MVWQDGAGHGIYAILCNAVWYGIVWYWDVLGMVWVFWSGSNPLSVCVCDVMESKIQMYVQPR